MAKMICINKPVKYNGTHYPSNMPFEVGENDVSYFISHGAWIVGESSVPVQEPEIPEVQEGSEEVTEVPEEVTEEVTEVKPKKAPKKPSKKQK